MSVEDRSWMYEGWNDNGRHSEVWVRNTNAFLDRAFSDVPNPEKYGVVCPCSECCNRVKRRRAAMSMHLSKRGFMPGYTRWTEHGEHIVSSSTLEDLSNTADGLDKEQTADSTAFNAKLAASKEPLHGRTSVSQLTAVAHLMAVKSQQKLSDECINSVLRLFGDVLPENHKMPNNLSECKRLLKDLKMPEACVDNCLICHKQDEQNGKCGESCYVVAEPAAHGCKQKLMENVAGHTGMPANVVPPLPPPPSSPTHGVSTSPENVGTFGSAVGV